MSDIFYGFTKVQTKEIKKKTKKTNEEKKVKSWQ